MTGHPPRATYRVQLHGGVGFDTVAAHVDYLAALGASHLYLSPVMTAPPGADHGYHIVDPRRVDPQLGGETALRRLDRRLAAHDMGVVLDIVPNHLAASPDNPLWADVLTHGRDSRYAAWFDIDWEAGDGRVVLPVLAAPLDEVLGCGLLTVEPDGPSLRYDDLRLPLTPATHDLARQVADRSGPSAGLRRLVDAQHYRLVGWREGQRLRNYRRFFDICQLVGVRVEDPQVFDARHRRLLALVADGRVTGLRVDHVDGLADPAGYTAALRRAADTAAGRHVYLVVEKILAGDEQLPDWPVEGTTGYEFADAVNQLQVASEGLTRLDATWRELTGCAARAADVCHDAKREVLDRLFTAEVEVLAGRFVDLAGRRSPRPDVDRAAVRDVLTAVTACLGVYRTYLAPGDTAGGDPAGGGEPAGTPSARDRTLLDRALTEARDRYPHLDDDARGLVEDVLTLRLPADADSELIRGWRQAVVRWQQLTGPAMAKGVEDTALYRYTRLTSLTEVGVGPHGLDHPGGPGGFHGRVAVRARRWPHTLNATSTHDTKRSEDVRARLAVLSEVADVWTTAVHRWRAANAPHRSATTAGEAPTGGEEWLIYQTLVGIWPLTLDDAAVCGGPPGGPTDPSSDPGSSGGPDRDLSGRLERYVIKAAREARITTSWRDPDPDHEAGLRRFVAALFDDREFLAQMGRFVGDHVALPGAVNSLAAVALKMVAPGVPDLYQGSELWDFSLVDPDNRRPVDWQARRQALAGLQQQAQADPTGLADRLRRRWRDGRVKLLVTWQALELRRRHPSVFRDGDYRPLDAVGTHADRVVAFARRHRDRWVAVLVPRLPAGLAGPRRWPVGEVWATTQVRLPPTVRPQVAEQLTGRSLTVRDGWVRTAEALAHLPVALLHAPAP